MKDQMKDQMKEGDHFDSGFPAAQGVTLQGFKMF